MGEFQMAVDGNGEVVTTAPAPVTVDGVAHKPGVFVADVSGYRWLVCRTCTDDALMPAWPCDAVAGAVGQRVPPVGAAALGTLPGDIPTDSAGPASSSASTSGTGGLADTAAQLAGNAKDLARLARDVREELEGRRRELWDATVQATRLAETGGSRSYANGLQTAYHLIASIDGEHLDRLLTAELDTRYGVDRAKSEGGEPS